MSNKAATQLFSVHEGEAFIYGGPVFSGDMAALIEKLSVVVREGFPALLVTVNVDHAIMLHEKNQIVEAYESATLRVVDGMPIAWLLRSLGAVKIHRLTGVDLMTSVVEAASAIGWRVAVLGGAPTTLEKAVRSLRSKFPHSIITGIEMPLLSSPEAAEGSEAVEKLRAFQPSIVFLCLGAPKQELWFINWRSTLPNAVYVGAGAAVDFAAGEKNRAPYFIQRIGMEWAWRMFQEFPRLAPRYLIRGTRFIPIVFSAMKMMHPPRQVPRRGQ